MSRTIAFPAPLTESGTDVLLRRVIAAPCERLWRAWADPVQLARWWGPHGSTNTVHALDFRTGGVLHLTMCSADGEQHTIHGRFQNVVHGTCIVLRSGEASSERTTITCVEHDDATVLTIRQHVPADASAPGPMTGPRHWGQCLDRLEEWLLKGHVHND